MTTNLVPVTGLSISNLSFLLLWANITTHITLRGLYRDNIVSLGCGHRNSKHLSDASEVMLTLGSECVQSSTIPSIPKFSIRWARWSRQDGKWNQRLQSCPQAFGLVLISSFSSPPSITPSAGIRWSLSRGLSYTLSCVCLSCYMCFCMFVCVCVHAFVFMGSQDSTCAHAEK